MAYKRNGVYIHIQSYVRKRYIYIICTYKGKTLEERLRI